MKRRTPFLFILLLVQSIGLLYSQDPTYSQFQATWMYANPSLTAYNPGTTFSGLARRQWIPIQNGRSKFRTSSFNLATQAPCLKSGFGVFYNENIEGEGDLRWQSYGGSYSFIHYIGRPTKGIFPADFRLGISGSYNTRQLNWDKLVFTGQLDPLLGIVSTYNYADVYSSLSRINYVDFSVGGSFRYYNQDVNKGFRVGAAAHHINRPAQALIGSPNLRLPIRWTIHGSMIMEQDGRRSSMLVPAFKLDWQKASTLQPLSEAATFWSGNYGIFWAFSNSPLGARKYADSEGFYVGVWAHHSSALPSFDWNHTGSIIGILGYVIKRDQRAYNLALSYEANVFGAGVGTGGAVEVSFSVNLQDASPCFGRGSRYPNDSYNCKKLPMPIYF